MSLDLVTPWSIEGLEFSRPSESLKVTKSRPHQVGISNPQKTSQSERLWHHLIKSINRQIKKCSPQPQHHILSLLCVLFLLLHALSWAVISFRVAAAYNEDISNHRPSHFPYFEWTSHFGDE